MAAKLRQGDKIYVPCSRLGLEDRPFALHETEVVSLFDRSVVVKLPGGSNSEPVGASLVHRRLGLAVIRIGDFQTEATLLDPLTKSVLQYCRLLVTDSALLLVEVRSLRELASWWSTHQMAYSHLVLIGHGRASGIRFAVDGWVDPDQLATELPCSVDEAKTVISLCCETGRAGFGKVFSSRKLCRSFVGPFNAVHGAIGSQFCQTFLAHQLLEGRTTKVAWRNAREAVPGSTSFRLWHRGQLG